MDIKTTKHLPLLALLSLLTACSAQHSGASGNQSEFVSQLISGSRAGLQSIPGSQLIGRQDRAADTKITTNKIQRLPSVPTPQNMRTIVMKAPTRPVILNTVQPRSNFGVTTYAPHLSFGASTNTAVKRVPVTKPIRSTQPKKVQNTMRRLTLNGSANFKSGSSTLTDAGQAKLLTLSVTLQEGNTKISRLLIEGHTDSLGNAAMNQLLSLKRANAVAEYLAKQGGYPRSTIQTMGLGESKPIASNKTREGRAQNRRVEIAAAGTRQITR